MKNKKENKLRSLKTILRIIRFLSKKRKYQLLISLLVMVLSSFAEVISITAVLPFLEIIVGSENSLENNIFNNFINLSSNLSQENQLFKITFIFIFFIVVAASIRLFNSYINLRLSAAIGSDIGIKAFKSLVFKPYSFFQSANSSTTLTITTLYINYVSQIIRQFLTLLTSTILSFSIVIGLLLISFKLTIAIFSILGLFYFLQGFYSKNYLNKTSKLKSEVEQKHVQTVQESYASIRDIIIDNSQKYFINEFSNLDIQRRRYEANMQFIQGFPKYIIECFGLILITLSCVFLYSYSESNTSVISIIGTITLGLQKLLPLLFSIYSAWAILKTYSYPVNLVLDLAGEHKHKPHTNFNYQKKEELKELSVKNLCFSYKRSKQNILEDVNFNIKFGDRIGIIGQTGSGKSTLIDLLMGLTKPDSGEIIFNSQNIHTNNKSLMKWRSLISHVPQEVILKDSTIAENIAFGRKINDINYSKLEEVIAKAKLDDLIKKLPNGYKTYVGERGINLSGGQKQRIGLARALYKNKKIIFLDEATSALDNKTEKEIINTIKNLDDNITVFLISHKISSLRFFTKFLKVENNTVNEIKNI